MVGGGDSEMNSALRCRALSNRLRWRCTNTTTNTTTTTTTTTTTHQKTWKRRFSSRQTSSFTRSKANSNNNSTNSGSTNSGTSCGTSSSSTSSDKWPVFYRLIRGGRVLFLSIGIYQIGYSQGCIDYGRNPEIMQNSLIEAQLKSNEAKHVYQPSSSIHQRVEPIFMNILESARSHVDAKINSNGIRIKEIDQQIKAHKQKEQLAEAGKLSSERNALLAESQELAEARKELIGNWRLCVNDSKIPNAFVNATIPRVIFVNEGLLSTFHPTDDEIALVLGHEISHLILGHSQHKLLVHIVLSASQLIIYSFVDPIGYSSWLLDALMNNIMEYLQNAHSRQCETEADVLGIAITARACYDTTEGSNIFNKFNKISHNHRTSFNKTHPGDLDRFENLTKLSEKENWKAYDSCKHLKKSWSRVLGL